MSKKFSLEDSEQSIAEADDIVIPQAETVTDGEAEEFAYKIIKRATALNGVKIDRGTFLRTELRKHCPNIDADLAVATTPIEAGALPEDIDKIACAVIDFETKKCAGLSFLAGIPGGVALVGTVPADLAQYFAHVMRVEQKLAYLYGWQTFLDDSNEIDDETVMELVILMGVMLEVGGVASSITKFAATVAQKGVQKTIQRQALTKTTFYPIMRNVLKVIGIKLTKETFAKTVSKVVPVIGGAVSGGLTYASFKPSAERLRKYLRALPLSGIDPREPDGAQESGIKLEEISSAVANQAQSIGSAAADRAHAARTTVSDGAKEMRTVATGIAEDVGSFFGSLGKRK